jgi:hypothetical protein
MPKFSNTAPKVKTPKSAITSVPLADGEVQPETYEGSPGYNRDDKSELFLLAVRNMVSEDSFYESGKDRDQRFVKLIHKVAVDDPQWIARFVPYLRNTMNMRSASIVMAAEAVYALLGKDTKGANLRSIIDSAIVRADEPAEMLAYWKSRYTGTVPKPVKRGVADATRRVYNEFSALKYDGQSREFRMADVIDLTRPAPENERQSNLFRWLLDRRHNRDDIKVEGLQVIEQWNILQAIPQSERRDVLKKNGNTILKNAGMTWEMLSGWIGGELTADIWESVIPSMGYMAILRNLRNFEKAGISKESQKFVIAKLTDPEEVAKSRQFPYRFLSAYKNTESVTYHPALEEALELSVQNIPALNGPSLVLVDLSGSMFGMSLSARSKVVPAQIGALFGAALSARTKDVTLVGYGTSSKEIRVPKGTSVLKLTETISNLGVGHGTETFAAISKHYDKSHKRVVIFTDQQSFGPRAWGGGSGKSVVDKLPVPIYNFDLGGYKTGHMDTGKENRYEFGGFTDQAFRMLDLLEKGKDVEWPF